MFENVLFIFMILVPFYLVIGFYRVVIGPRYNKTDARRKRAYGEVKNVRELQNGRIVIVEYFVDGNTYRCVDSSYGYVVREGEHIEVFYDTLDPRESTLGRILQGDLNTITCTKCVGPVNINEPVCPYCGFLLTPEIYNSNVHDKPIMESNKIFSGLKKFLPIFLIMFFTIEIMMITVSLLGNDYMTFSNAVILLVITLIVFVVYKIKSAVVYDNTTTGEVVYVHEQTLNNDDIRNWAVVAEFEVNGKKYRSVNNYSLICYNECEEVMVKYNSIDPRQSEIKKLK